MLRDSTRALLARAVLERQRSGRVPGIHASVVRRVETLWAAGVGTAEVGTDRAPTAEDQFLIASNTKTFVATMVMQLRDEGRLDLDDELARHLPGLGHRVTVRDALSHLSGMQREPVGEVWVTLEHPDAQTLLREAGQADRCCGPASSGTTPTSCSPCSARSWRGSTAARGRSHCGCASSIRSG